MKIGCKIKQLRISRGLTQEQLANYLNVTNQAVSKWENQTSSPDIEMLPILADTFGISIDELLDYKLNALTNKERFIRFMSGNGILEFGDFTLKSTVKSNYYINTEKFVTNVQIAKLGEYFADFIRENNIVADAVIGMAYSGIHFSIATACYLYQKYGCTIKCCSGKDKYNDSEQEFCGYDLKDGDKVIIIEDIISSGKTLLQKFDKLTANINVEIVAVLIIANRMIEGRSENLIGSAKVESAYNTKVYSIITHEDIQNAIESGVIPNV